VLVPQVSPVAASKEAGKHGAAAQAQQQQQQQHKLQSGTNSCSDETLLGCATSRAMSQPWVNPDVWST
jgi:hypothetical protein